MTNNKTTRRAVSIAGAIALGAALLPISGFAGESKMLETNKGIALGLSKAIMAGDWKKVDMMITDDFQYIVDGRPAIGKQAYIGFMKNVLSTAMTDMKMDFPRVIAEGNLVAVDYTNQMTHSGPFFGIPASGKRVVATGQFIREIRDGKVSNEWQTTNSMGLMAQITKK